MMKGMLKMRMGMVANGGLGLAALMLSGSAVADTTVTFSGYECLFAGSSGDQSGFAEGARINASYTMCPMDRLDSGNTSSITNIHIRVRDTSSSGNIECFAVSCDGLGVTCSLTGSEYTSGTGDQFLSLGSVAAYSNGYAYIFCDMPNETSLIYSYRSTD